MGVPARSEPDWVSVKQMVPIFYKRLPREPDAAMISDIISQHNAILQAIIDRDPDAAQKAVEVHGEFIEVTLRNADYTYWREHTAQKRLEMLSKAESSGQRFGPVGKRERVVR